MADQAKLGEVREYKFRLLDGSTGTFKARTIKSVGEIPGEVSRVNPGPQETGEEATADDGEEVD